MSPSLEPSLLPSTAPSKFVSKGPSISQEPTQIPSSAPSKVPSGTPSVAPSAKPSADDPNIGCVVRQGIVQDICLQRGDDNSYACFVVEDLVPFTASDGCIGVSVTFNSCAANAESLPQTGIDKQSSPVIDHEPTTTNDPFIFPITNKVIDQGPVIDHGPTTPDNPFVFPVIEEDGGTKIHVDQLGGITVTYGSGTPVIEEDTGHLENVDGGYVILEDSGGYVEVDAETTTTTTVRGESSRRRRRRPTDTGETIRKQFRRVLHRRHIRSEEPTPAPVGLSDTDDVGSPVDNATIENHKGGKSSGDSKGKKSGGSKSKSGSKSRGGKKGGGGKGGGGKGSSKSKSKSRSSEPTPAPAPSFTNSPIFIVPPIPTLFPTPAPIINALPTVGDQRSIDFSSVDCTVSCVDFGDLLCLRASATGTGDSITRVTYTVSDISGVSETFDVDVIIAAAPFPSPSCIESASTCTALTRSSPQTGNQLVTPPVSEPTPSPTLATVNRRRGPR
jgi:uncharacterized membrane protein YgcG